MGSKFALFRVKDAPGPLRLERKTCPEIQREALKTEFDDQAVELQLDAAGRLWVGYQDGIAWLDDEGRLA